MSAPKIRFKNFVEPYSNFRIGDVIDKLESGVSVNSEDIPALLEVENGVLKTSCISDGIFNRFENKKILSDEVSRAKLNPLKDSILVSRMNTPQLVGEVGYVDEDFPNLFVPDRLWLVRVRDKDHCWPRWLSYQLTTKKFKAKLTSISSGTSGSMKNISQPNFINLEITIPSIDEQQKIASFLSIVDQKISLLTKNHELLLQYKKGVMQKIFNQEIRFKDDDGQEFSEWQQFSLGEVGEIVTGKTPKTGDRDLWGGELLFVTPTDIAESKFQYKSARSVTKTPKLKILPKNSIMFTCIASIGKMALSAKECITNQQINSIIPHEKFDSEYIYYALLNVVDYIKSTKSSSTLPIINKTEFSKFIIGIPSSKEQQMIAKFISSIDRKIELFQSQITLTKQYKQGLLQQMFI
jgi:type I restriction enzyme S subunit